MVRFPLFTFILGTVLSSAVASAGTLEIIRGNSGKGNLRVRAKVKKRAVLRTLSSESLSFHPRQQSWWVVSDGEVTFSRSVPSAATEIEIPPGASRVTISPL